MPRNRKFIFDLDGTITAEETLPLIARHFHIERQIAELTSATLAGKIPFVESFMHRVKILGRLPISQIDALLSGVRLHEKVSNFIREHSSQCAIATGNLCFWIDSLVRGIGCEWHCSLGLSEDDRVKKLTKVLKKEEVVKHYQNLGYQVVFIGDSNNDAEAMRLAEHSIAAGLTHRPANSVLAIADARAFDEESLCRQLNQLL